MAKKRKMRKSGVLYLSGLFLLLLLTSCAGVGRIANEQSTPATGPSRRVLIKTKTMVQEQFTVNGVKRAWLDKCAEALRAADFTTIRMDVKPGVLSAVYNGFGVAGSISIVISQAGEMVIMNVTTYGQLTNFYAFFINPSANLMERFKKTLPELP